MASLRVLALDHEGRPVAFDTWLDDLQLYLLGDTKDNVSLFDHVSGAATAPPATADSATRSQRITVVLKAHRRGVSGLATTLHKAHFNAHPWRHARQCYAGGRQPPVEEDVDGAYVPTAEEVAAAAADSAGENEVEVVVQLEGSHTASLIAKTLEGILAEWGLTEMLFAVTTDNAENNNKAMRMLAGDPAEGAAARIEFPLFDKDRHVRCIAHVMNIAVQAALKKDEVKEALKRLRAALYDVVVTRYSSPATTALGRMLLPYLFPELSAFAKVEDLVSHLRASDARYRAALPAEFLARNPPPMYIPLYFVVTRLPDFLRSVRDQFISLEPTSLTVDLLEQHLLAYETSAVAVGAARGTPCPPFFEGCSPSPLAPSYASAAAVNFSVAENVGAASASATHRSSKGKGGKGGGGGSGGGGGGSGSSGGGSGGSGGGSGTGGGSGGSGGGGGGSSGSGGSGGGGTGGGGIGARRVGSGVRAGQTCGKLHTQHRCFSRLDVAWRAEFGDHVELPCWVDLLRSRIAIFDLDFDAILSAMYALSVSAEGDCYRCVPPDPGIATAALGASEPGTLPGTAPTQALHTFTLDSGASRCFFRDNTTLTPLPAPVLVRLADPSRGPVVARSSTILLCPTVLSGSMSGLHLPSFSTNLVSTAAAMVTTTTHGGSSLYTLATEPPQGLPSYGSCLPSSHSHLLVSGLPRSLPPLPPSPAPPCLPYVEGRQRAAPHSSSFPVTIAPLQTLHMDVWGPALVSGQGHERLFLLVVDDYTQYTTVFPLRSKGEVADVLIRWIRTVRLQLRERFGQDLPVLRLHSDRGGEFSSDLLRDFCCGEGILQSFMLPDSRQQNGIAERRIGLVMEVAHTSMIHAAAPHFHWPFAVRYAAHQLNLWPRVSLPETSPTLCWTGEVGDASVFRFYHPTSRHVFPSQDVTFDESVPFYRLFPYRSAPPPPPPLFLAPGPPPVDPLPPQGPAPLGVSQVDPLPGTALVQVAVGSGAARGAASRGAVSGGAASGGAEPGGAESEGAGSGGAEPGGEEPGGAEPAGVETGGVEPGGAESAGAEFGGAEPRGAASSGGPATRLSPQQLREWFVRCACLWSGAPGAGSARVTARAGGPGGTAATGPGGARTRGTGAAGTGAGAVDPGAGGPRGTVQPQPFFVPLLQQVHGVTSYTGLNPPLLCPPLDQLRLPLRPASPLPAPSPYTAQSGGLTVRRRLASRPVSPVCTARRVPRSRPPPVPGTHTMALRPSSVPLRVPLPPPPESSLPEVPDTESDRARAASPTIARLLTIAVTDPSFDSAATSALVAELLDFAAACRLDYATALVAESTSAGPPSVEGECALGTNVLDDRQEDFECLAAAVPRFASMLLAPEGDPDAPDIPTPCS
ncbi:unnamed protein product [Closterium sp. NIES-53]